MFNKSFDLLDFINDIPSMEVKGALHSAMRDSLNFKLVNSANVVAEAIENEGFDIKEFSVADAERFLMGADIGDDSLLRDLRAQMALRNLLEKMANHYTVDTTRRSLRDKLKRGERPAYGTLTAAIESSCGVQPLRVKVNTDAEAKLEAIGIKTTEQDRMADAIKTRDAFQRYANEKAQRKGAIEWLLDQVLNSEADDTFLQLEESQREDLVTKIKGKMEQLEAVAASNVRSGAKGLGLGDIVILKEEVARLMRESYTTPGMTPPKVVQADAPGPKAKRVKKMSAADAQKLADSLHAIATT